MLSNIWRMAACCLLLVWSFCSVGCATGRLNLWPVYFHEVREVAGPRGREHITETEVLYPIFHRESRPGETWHAVRPLYNYEQDTEQETRQLQYLWPLGLHFTDGRQLVRHRLFPLFGFVKSWADSHRKWVTHAHLLQILRWGNDDEFGPYFALFPLAGVTHGVIADTWSFILFPLYSHYQQGDYVRDDFPWPVLGWGRTPDRRKAQYRFWPFYVHLRNHAPLGTYVRNDLLWPFVRWGRLDMGGRYYSTYFGAVPFVSLLRTWTRDEKLVAYKASVLGFIFGEDRRDEKRHQDEAGWGALWWLIRSKQGPRRDELRVFPLYWRTTHYTSTEKDPATAWVRRRMPWPIIWQDRDRREPDVDRWSLVLAPFYWHHAESEQVEEGGGDRTGRTVTLWPLATWRTTRDGGRDFWILSHGWKDETKGFKRNYRAFLDFFQYHRTPEGLAETRVLSRLYHHRRGPCGRYLSLAGLFTYDNTAEVVGEEGPYWEVLFGLIKRSPASEGPRWRLLFIPFG